MSICSVNPNLYDENMYNIRHERILAVESFDIDSILIVKSIQNFSMNDVALRVSARKLSRGGTHVTMVFGLTARERWR